MQWKQKTGSHRPAAVAGILLALAVGALGFAPRAWAQATSGTLAGHVVDKSGGPLPGVTVTAAQKATGYERSTVTGADGGFRLPSVLVGSYTVKADLAGFGSVTVDDVQIDVASSRNLEITLAQSAIAESITVVDEAPLIANTPSVGAVVSQQELDNLPLNGRQFANLAVLAPGTTLGHNTDPTKPGQLVVELNGGIGRNVNYTIDGGDNTDDTIGGALQNFSVEGVQEFKIQTMEYKAEFGRSTGGVLSVVTKSGTNRFTGSGYGFFRNDSLDSRTQNEINNDSAKQPLDRKQYGGSLGGPILQDKVHFFVTYEKTDRTTSYIVDSHFPIASIAGQASTLPFNDQLFSGKLSYDISPKQYLQVRYGYQKNTDKYGASPLAAPSSLGTVTNNYKSLLAGLTSQLGSDMLNEILFQYSKFNNAITADSNQPFIYYPSGFSTGQNINTPQHTNQTKYQYKDDFGFSTTLGGQRHDFKTGLAYIHEPVLGGDFTTGTTGQYSTLTDQAGSPITDITIFGGFNGDNTPVNQYSAFVQDDWAVNNRLTLNLGLRYDLWTGFNLDQRSNPIWQTLATQTISNAPIFRQFMGGKGGVLKNDNTDFAPRLGFVWDTGGDGKRLLRGGWGIYYDFPYTNSTILFPASAVQSNYGVVYNFHDSHGIKNPDGSFFQPGQPLPPNQLPGAAIPPPNEVAAPNLSNTPRSYQGSLGYSWQVNDALGLNIEGVDIEYHDLPFRSRANIDPATGNPIFTQFGNFRVWESDATGTYRGLNLGLRYRLGSKLTVQGFYTLSKATGITLAGADEFRLTDVQYQPDLRGARDASIDPGDPLCGRCTGPLNTDARHRVSLGAVYLAPWQINVAAMFRYHSGTPFMITEPFLTSREIILPPGVGLNSGRTGSFEQFDLRLSKTFTIYKSVAIEGIAEVFNLFNAKNPAEYNGVVGTATFGQPAVFAGGDPAQGEQRLVQLGVRLSF
jgi:outer membrane receptor protein involved in Fe transport